MSDVSPACAWTRCPKNRRKDGPLCSTHAERKRLGKPMDAPIRAYIRDEKASYWTRVDKNGPVSADRPDLDPCWMWTGFINPVSGYGQFHRTKLLEYAHRYAYKLAFGEIPEDLHIDHICCVRACVNPAHLEAVTQQENNVRAGATRRSRKGRG
jgi:hypothetical protein